MKDPKSCRRYMGCIVGLALCLPNLSACVERAVQSGGDGVSEQDLALDFEGQREDESTVTEDPAVQLDPDLELVDEQMGEEPDLEPVDLEPVDQPTDLGADSIERPDLERAMWCATQWPHSTATSVGVPSEPLFVQLWVEGVSPSNGLDPTLRLEIGWGPLGVLPDQPSWSWVPGEHNPYCADCGDNEEFMATVRPTAVGEQHWAARLSYANDGPLYCDRADGGRMGSDDGWSFADAPRLTVLEAGELSLITLNLRCLVDDWDARLPIIADGLASLRPDLMGFQEVCAEPSGRDNLGELVAALGERTGASYQVERVVTHWSFDQYEEGVAVVSPHPINDVSAEILPAGIFQRRILMGRVATPEGQVLFATTHLDHRSDEARAEQIQVVVASLAERRRVGEPVVLSGDLNEVPGGSVEEELKSAGYTDVWRELHPDESGPTFPSNAPRRRIDYIWFDAAGSLMTPSSIGRILDSAVGGVYGSDHLGVHAIIRR